MVPGDVFQSLVQEDDRDGDLEDHNPLGPAERGHLEDQLRGHDTRSERLLNTTQTRKRLKHDEMKRKRSSTKLTFIKTHPVIYDIDILLTDRHRLKHYCLIGKHVEFSHRQRLNVEDQEVEGEREDDGSQQPNINPGRHPEQGLVLRQTVRDTMEPVRTAPPNKAF